MNKTLKKGIIILIKTIGKKIFCVFKKEEIPPCFPNKILIISLHYRGDVLFTTPAIKAIREKYPLAHITIWVKTRAKDILLNSPQIDEILIFDDINTAGKREKDKRINIRGKIKLVFWLKKKKIDLVFDFTGLWITAIYAFLSGAKYRFGFNQHGFGFLLTREFPLVFGKHFKERSLNILRQLQIPIENENLELYLGKKEIKFAEDFLANLPLHSFTFGIHPFAEWHSKCWELNNFAKLCKQLNQKYQANIIIFGGSQDKKNLFELIRLTSTKLIIACGKTTLGQTAALMQKCHLIIGNDTGPTYFAEALNIPAVIIFGSTNPIYSQPKGEKYIVLRKKLTCSPKEDELYCHNQITYQCTSYQCMKLIAVEEVLQAIVKLLDKIK